MKKEIKKPTPPPPRLWCDACGRIDNGKHTNWICRFLHWLDDGGENNASSKK